MEEVMSSMLPYIKLLFSHEQDAGNSLGSLQKDTESAPVTSGSKSGNVTYKNKLNKLYFLENLLDTEIDEVQKEEKPGRHKAKSKKLGPKFKQGIFEKRWEPAWAEEDSLAEIKKAERQLLSTSRAPRGDRKLKEEALQGGKSQEPVEQAECPDTCGEQRQGQAAREPTLSGAAATPSGAEAQGISGKFLPLRVLAPKGSWEGTLFLPRTGPGGQGSRSKIAT